MSAKKHPNIVLIVLDTHRRDRLTHYGYQRETSPNLAHFAHDNTIFDNAISPAQWTIPAHSSMFTGEYPTTHQALQANGYLDERFETLAQILARNGYQTTGFCNNPLLGVLNNGLKRGFDTFYNYSGAVPSVPKQSNRLPAPWSKLWEWYTQQLRKLSYPFQNLFAHSDWMFQIALHPKIVPHWIEFGNFKGHTANSIRDTLEFLENAHSQPDPQFVFLNLMETHLPFWPPDNFIDKFAPYFKEEREARDYARRYNAETFRWLLPIEEALDHTADRVVNDLYDAEVCYQDHLLAPLLDYLNQAEDTLTVIVADHGEGIGEHSFMGHSFVAYQELVHVPLMIKFPAGRAAQARVSDTVSTRRLFHTILHSAGIKTVPETEYRPAIEVSEMSLTKTVAGRDPERGLVFAEAYPPTTFLFMIKKRAPQLIDRFHCDMRRWAAYEDGFKLVRLDSVQDELFDLNADPAELHNVAQQHPERATRLSQGLKTFITHALSRQPDSWHGYQTSEIELDENMTRQLRALGYLD